MIKKSLLTAIALTSLAATAPAAVLTNGSLDAWTGVTGTPPAGTPIGWYTSAPAIQTAGLTSGSVYSATIAGTNVLVQNGFTPQTNFTLSYNFVATAPSGGVGVNQGMRLNLFAGTTETIVMSFVIFNDANGLTLSARNTATSAWVPIATGLSPSVYDAATGVYTTSNVYNFSVTADWSASSYSVTLGLNGGTQTTYSNITSYYTNPNGLTLGKIYFYDNNGTNGGTFAVDNLNLETVPEPTTVALLSIGAALVFYRVKRRERIAH